jgi:hypothetical protein
MLTTTDLSIAAKVDSSAISHLEIVAAEGDSWAWDLLVTFTSGDKVYRYAWEDEAECIRWFELLSDEEAKAATSWGRLFHHALKHGDIEQIDM